MPTLRSSKRVKKTTDGAATIPEEECSLKDKYIKKPKTSTLSACSESDVSELSNVPSCYVVDASVSPGGLRRWDQYVFNSRKSFESWLELEFKNPFSLSVLLSYGEDVLLRVFEGGKCVYDEWLLNRLRLVFKGVQIHFENVRTCTEKETNDYYERDRKAPAALKPDTNGNPCHVQPLIGGTSMYDIFVNAQSCEERCLCGTGDDRCKGTLFECQTYKCEIMCLDKKQLKKKVTFEFDWSDFPDLPSRPLAQGEKIEIDEEYRGVVSSVHKHEFLELGRKDLENGERVERDISEGYNY